MRQADIYRINAQECFDVAERCQEIRRRMQLLNMALMWLRLVEQAEINGKTDLVYESPPQNSGTPDSGSEHSA